MNSLRQNTGYASSGASVATEMTPLSIDTTNRIPRLIPPALSPLGELNLGFGDFTHTNPMHPALFTPPRSGTMSPMQGTLQQEGMIMPAPRARRRNLSGMTAEERLIDRNLRQAQYRASRRAISNQHQRPASGNFAEQLAERRNIMMGG